LIPAKIIDFAIEAETAASSSAVAPVAEMWAHNAAE